MFDQSFLDDAAGSKRRWSVIVSAFAQIALIGLVAFLPLIFTYQLPVDEWEMQAVLFTPLAPQEPPPPPELKAQQLAKPARFEELLRQPTVIPEHVVLVGDSSRQVALSGQVPGGVVGAVTEVVGPDLPPLTSFRRRLQRSQSRLGAKSSPRAY